MSNVIFETDEKSETRASLSKNRRSKLVRWCMKLGIKSEQGAIFFLLLISIVMILIAATIFSNALKPEGNNSDVHFPIQN